MEIRIGKQSFNSIRGGYELSFDECPNCSSKSAGITSVYLYECEECGDRFCSNCRMHADGRCPHCGSDDDNHKKLGMIL